MGQDAHRHTEWAATFGSDAASSPDRPGTSSIMAAFKSVVRRHKDKVAVEYADRKVRYRGLDTFATGLSARLRDVGGGASKARVAFLLDDRIHALVAILGILRAGHAFVPLDAADPEERIKFILEDSEPFALVADGTHFARARGLAPRGCALVNLREIALRGRRRYPVDVDPDDPAYVFYTSGSTGQPKGVCQTHRNLLHFVGCYSRMLHIGEGDRLSLLYSLSFSAANMDVFGGLLGGATLCAYDMRKRGIPALADWLDGQRVTVLHTVPTLFRALAAGLDAGRILESVRAIDLGGEAVTVRDVELFRDHFRPDCLLVNHLAATEASVIAQHAIDPERTHASDMLPVGLCPDGVSVRIERPDGSEAATDEVGRIVVASPFVSPGYWRRPELNATAFSEDPARPGYRIFRTDDMGRIGPDGQLYFLGREGTRVKLRGQSVDLAEVEAAARRCTGVRDAAVVAGRRENGAEADFLVAHMVVTNPAEKDAKRLRRELAAYLPHYMIPSAFAFPDSLPMTASGKVDRRSLQQQQDSCRELPDPQSSPVGKLEQEVATIFSSILDRRVVGRTDDFYLLGGDSMSSVELQIRLSELIGQEVPIEAILKDSTVSGLAAALQRMDSEPRRPAGQHSVLLPLRGGRCGPTLFLVHGRLGQAHVSRQFLDLLGEDRPVYSLQARGADGVDPPNRTIAEMAVDYSSAIGTVQPFGPYLLGGFCAGGYVAIEIARMLRAQGHEVLPLLLIDPPPPPFSLRSSLQKVLIRSIPDRLRLRQSQGRIGIDVGNPDRFRAAVRVAMAFERAMSAHRPEPYDGEAYLLASAGHLTPEGWGDRKNLEAVFSGRLRILDSMTMHSGMFNVRNRKFAEHMRQYLRRVQDLIGGSQSLPASDR